VKETFLSRYCLATFPQKSKNAYKQMNLPSFSSLLPVFQQFWSTSLWAANWTGWVGVKLAGAGTGLRPKEKVQSEALLYATKLEAEKSAPKIV